MFKRFVATLSGVALLGAGLVGLAPVVSAVDVKVTGAEVAEGEPFEETRPRYKMGRPQSQDGGFEIATSDYYRVAKNDLNGAEYTPPAAGETLFIQEEETNIVFEKVVTSISESTAYYMVYVQGGTLFSPPHNTYVRLGEPLNPAAPSDRPLVFSTHESGQAGHSKNGQLETFKIFVHNPTGVKGGRVEATSSLDGGTIASGVVASTEESVAEVILQGVLKADMTENTAEFLKVNIKYTRDDGLEYVGNALDIRITNTPEGSYHYDSRLGYSSGSGGFSASSDYIRIRNGDLNGTPFGPFEVGDSLKWRKLGSEDWVEKEVKEASSHSGYWRYYFYESVSWPSGFYEFKEVDKTEPAITPVKIQRLAANEDDDRYENLTPAWTSVLGDECADGQYDSTGTCPLGDVSYNGNVWDETLRLVFPTKEDADAVSGIQFEDKDGVKLQGVIQTLTGPFDGEPKVHVRLPQGLAEGDVTMRMLINGAEDYPLTLGVLNRVGLTFDLKEDEELEVSEKSLGSADYWCEPVSGSPSTLRFEDVDFEAACASYKNGTPGLALPYQVYQMEETGPDTFRFKPHCLGDFTAKWGNRSGPDGEATYGCVPPLETCSALGGKLSQYNNGYGIMIPYCDLNAEVLVSLTGPSEVDAGETVTYTVTLTSTDPIQAGTLSLVSKDAVVGTEQVPAGSASSLYSFTLTANVEQEVSSLEDLAYPLQAFYDVPHQWGKDEKYESSVLVVNVIPNPEMCVALGKGPEVSARSLDIDGDGVTNLRDSDIDGDEVANYEDSDIDGDGVSNAEDTTPEGPPARPTPPNFWEEDKQQELAWEIQEHLYGENYPSTFPLPVDPDSGEEETFADGAGVLVPAPSYEMVVEVLEYTANEACGIDTDWDGNGGGTPEKPTDPGSNGGNGGGTDTNTGAYPILGDGGSASPETGLNLRLITPAEAYQGVETELVATVDATDGAVEFGVQEVDLKGNQSARILGSAPVQEGEAKLTLTPKAYGDVVIYARYTGKSGVDTTAGATTVNPAPFIDEFTLRVGGELWGEMPKGEVLPYGYHKVTYTTESGNAPQLEVEGPCQVMSTKSIPAQITMLGTAIAPERCKVTVTTGGYEAYAPKSWVFDVANAMGNQGATLAADKASSSLKVGESKVLAKKGESVTEEDYKLKGKPITWKVKDGQEVCSVKTTGSGKVTVTGKKQGACTVVAKAAKVKGKYKSFVKEYRYQVK